MQNMQQREKDPLTTLVAELKHPIPTQRVRAAQALRQFGPDAVEPLCALLKDPDRAVRDAAVVSLGEIGDERAIDPLIETLRNTFAWRKPWFQVIAGIGLVGVALIGQALVLAGGLAVLGVLVALSLFLIRFFEGQGLLTLWGAGWDALKSVLNWFKFTDFFHFRRRQNAYCLTIASALARIAEHSPTPELRDALPDLNAVASDFIQQDSRTREAAAEVALRIQSLTEKLQNLPVSSSSAALDATSLPRVGGALEPDKSDLPSSISHEQSQTS